MRPLIILAGPTASGKTETALALAEHFGSEIISADSLQVYKYFDIGTAKPHQNIRKRVPHHLIDILEPDQDFTAFQFKLRALEIVRNCLERNEPPVLVGGTGLYLKTLTEDYECAVAVSAATREKVKSLIRDKGPEEMHKELAKVDPEYAEKIRPTDPTRIARALSVFMESGKKLSDFHVEDNSPDMDIDWQYFLLEWDRKELYANIERRVDSMIENGLVDEVKSLLDRGYGKDLKPFQSIGYTQVVKHLEGQYSLDQAVNDIKKETRNYAKRQITWFKKIQGAFSIQADSQDTPLTLRDKILACLPQNVAVILLTIFILGSQPVAVNAESASFQEGVRLFQKGNYEKAANQFLTVQTSQSGTGKETKNRVLYFLGKIHIQNEQYSTAIDFLNEALDEYPEIEDYIRFELAQAHYASGDYQSALDHLNTVLQNFPQTRLYPEVELLRADTLKELDEPALAADYLQLAERRIKRSSSYRVFSPYIPDFIFKQGELYEILFNFDEAVVHYKRLHINFPSHPLTLRADQNRIFLVDNEKMNPASFSVDDYLTRIKGLLKSVNYQQAIDESEALRNNPENTNLPAKFYFYLAQAHRGMRMRAEANLALEEFLSVFPVHSKVQEARFRIGRNLWNLGDSYKAVRFLESALRVNNKRGDWAIKSHFFLGRISEDRQQFGQAIKWYKTLVKKFGKTDYGQKAAWRIGWINYLQGKYFQSGVIFNDNIRHLPDGLLVEKNMFWQAKALEQQNRKTKARKIYLDLHNRFPYSYYGIRALEKLNSMGFGIGQELPDENGFQKANFKSIDNEPIELYRPLKPEERSHYIRANEMIEMGFDQNARLEIRQIEQTVRKNLSGVLWLSHFYNRAQAYEDSLRILELFKIYKTKKNERQLTVRFWKNFFPLAYSAVINTYSSKYDVDPLLVKGIIRQESRFNTWSLSMAGARGLMQIMPETGRQLSSQLPSLEFFEPELLFDPEINLHMGIKYISNLTRRFGENGHHILISYNAGPHVLKAWLERFKNLEDRDVFIESIPYPETRGYVKKVLRNYGTYKMLYQKDI